jgi:hypothetical protein
MSGPENETPKKTTRSKSSASKAPPEPEPAQPSSSGASQATQATAAVTNAVSVVREKLVAGEQMALSAAGLIVLVWIIWDLILDYPTMSTFTLLVAVLMVLSIWVHRWGHYDFGNGYRILIGALGLSLALFAVTNLLLVFRNDLNSGAMDWLGSLLFWIGGIVAGYAAWLVFRIREA